MRCVMYLSNEVVLLYMYSVLCWMGWVVGGDDFDVVCGMFLFK